MARGLIFDPQAVPVLGTDADLPAVRPEQLTAQAMLERFARPPIWSPEFTGDGLRLGDRPPAPASVLVPLVQHAGELRVLLTQRTAHLKDHAGQVSFPGGRSEPEDVDTVETALREAHEEIGLHREHIDVLGFLPVYTTVTSFAVTPVVALVRPGFTLTLDAFEVAEAFEVPLSFLMTPAHHRRHAVEIEGLRRQFLSMPWTPPPAQESAQESGQRRSYFIWGATAAILRNFYRFLAA